MSVTVAERAEQMEKIESIFGTFREVTVSESSKAAEFEKKVNAFLDGILTRKEYLLKTTQQLDELMPRLEEFTWFTDNDEALTSALRKLIDTMTHLHGLLVRNYVSVTRYFAKHKIGKAELAEFKATIDDFKELAGDLENTFFPSPQSASLQEATKRLDSLC